MSELPRWKISELETRYTLEPELEDYFVEGFFDKEILEKYCSENNVKNKNFYPVHCIEVNADVLRKYSLSNGNKQRLLALALELSHIKKKSIVILVDKDLDAWLKSELIIENLHYTEFTCLEISLVDDTILKDIITKVALCKICDWDSFIYSFYNSLRTFFLIRMTSVSLNLNLKWLDPRKNLTFEFDEIYFDHLKYIDKLLSNNSNFEKKSIFLEKFKEFENCNSLDYRYIIRGHDLIYLLAFVINNAKGLKEFNNSVTLKRLLLFNTKNVTRNFSPYRLFTEYT